MVVKGAGQLHIHLRNEEGVLDFFRVSLLNQRNDRESLSNLKNNRVRSFVRRRRRRRSCLFFCAVGFVFFAFRFAFFFFEFQRFVFGCASFVCLLVYLFVFLFEY